MGNTIVSISPWGNAWSRQLWCAFHIGNEASPSRINWWTVWWDPGRTSDYRQTWDSGRQGSPSTCEDVCAENRQRAERPDYF